MARQFQAAELLIATSNQGKIVELVDLFQRQNIPVQIRSLRDFPAVTAPEENGSSFAANAEIKARFYANHTGLPSLADDSGLAVDALDGLPGIHSARWAGDEQRFDLAMARIETLLAEKNQIAATARFVCALALYWPKDNHVEHVVGTVQGHLRFPPAGNKGFGYDPIFVPVGHSRCFAEMDTSEKQKISHRKRAFDALMAQCFSSDRVAG